MNDVLMMVVVEGEDEEGLEDKEAEVMAEWEGEGMVKKGEGWRSVERR